MFGLHVAVPYIVTSRFIVKPNGHIQFKSNPLFYVFLFGLRYLVRDKMFHKYPILFPNHRPDIELMLAEYIAVLVIFTFAWRLWLYVQYRRTLQSAVQPDLTKPTVGLQ